MSLVSALFCFSLDSLGTYLLHLFHSICLSLRTLFPPSYPLFLPRIDNFTLVRPQFTQKRGRSIWRNARQLNGSSTAETMCQMVRPIEQPPGKHSWKITSRNGLPQSTDMLFWDQGNVILNPVKPPGTGLPQSEEMAFVNHVIRASPSLSSEGNKNLQHAMLWRRKTTCFRHLCSDHERMDISPIMGWRSVDLLLSEIHDLSMN